MNVGRWKKWASVSTATLLIGLVLPLGGSTAAAASVVPAGFEDQLVAKVGGPTAIAFTPDGRILVTSHFGQLFVIQGGALVPTPAIDLGAKVCDDKERGLLGVAVDPAFSSNHYIYLYYTFKKFGSCPYDTTGVPVNRVSRFVLPNTNVVDPATETILIDNVPNEDGIHNAGDLAVRERRQPLRQRRRRRLRLRVRQRLRQPERRGARSERPARQDPAHHAQRRHPGRQSVHREPAPRGATSTGHDDRRHEVPGDLRLGAAEPVPDRVRSERRRHDASTSTTWARPPGRRSTSARPAPTTAGTCARARAPAAHGPTAVRRPPG